MLFHYHAQCQMCFIARNVKHTILKNVMSYYLLLIRVKGLN